MHLDAIGIYRSCMRRRNSRMVWCVAVPKRPLSRSVQRLWCGCEWWPYARDFWCESSADSSKKSTDKNSRLQSWDLFFLVVTFDCRVYQLLIIWAWLVVATFFPRLVCQRSRSADRWRCRAAGARAPRRWPTRGPRRWRRRARRWRPARWAAASCGWRRRDGRWRLKIKKGPQQKNQSKWLNQSCETTYILQLC